MKACLYHGQARSSYCTVTLRTRPVRRRSCTFATWVSRSSPSMARLRVLEPGISDCPPMRRASRRQAAAVKRLETIRTGSQAVAFCRRMSWCRNRLACFSIPTIRPLRPIAIPHPSPAHPAGQPQAEQLRFVGKAAQAPRETEALPFQALRLRGVAPGGDVGRSASFPLPDHRRDDLDRPKPPGGFRHAQVEQGVVRRLGRVGGKPSGEPWRGRRYQRLRVRRQSRRRGRSQTSLRGFS